MNKAMPIGIEDFQEIITQDYYFVDKTDFIRQFIDDHSKVTLFTRPRRFGKTLTLSMLDWFFSVQKKDASQNLFQNLTIFQTGKKYLSQQGRFPVIFISLKEFSALTWESMLDEWQEFLQDLFLQHTYLRDSERVQSDLIEKFQDIAKQRANTAALSKALALLMRMMRQYYGQQVILLIDEYDAPAQLAWKNHYYKDCIAFMRRLLSTALKTNPDLKFSILTGVMRIAKESIFSGLNNLNVYTVMDDNFSDVFGFTPDEIKQMAADLQRESYLPEMKKWYDGYHFGNSDIYNPWSVINFFDRQRLGNYWVNTSGNSIIQHMLRHLSNEQEEILLQLLHRQSITASIREGVIYDDIDRNEDTLYTMLLTTGYLTAISKRYGISGLTCKLAIPNREIQDVFRVEILDRLKAGLSISRLEDMLDDLLNGRAENFAQRLSLYIRYLVSSYDTANKESFYHGFLLGMTALFVPDYIVESNRESGYGRFDLAIFPKDTNKAGVILEFKAADSEEHLPEKAQEALQQINNREYITAFEKHGIQKVWKYGIAFYQKKIYVCS